MPSTPICLCLPHFIQGCDRVTVIYLQPSQSSPQAQTHTGGAHTHTHTHTQWQLFSRPQPHLQYQPPILPDPTSKPPEPPRTRLGLPERLSPGSGVTGSRGLKLIFSLWSRSALFSLLSSCSGSPKKVGIAAPAGEKGKKKKQCHCCLPVSHK